MTHWFDKQGGFTQWTILIVLALVNLALVLFLIGLFLEVTA